MKRIWILLLAAAVLFLVSSCGNRGENSELKEETQVPEGKQAETTAAETEKTAEEKPQTTEQPFLVQVRESDPYTAYVLVRMQGILGLLPLPTEGEYTKTIRQTMEDGNEAINILYLTPEGFRMEEANCEGQDCVGEGMVTLENREERVLWNMVVCLPHQLVAELITKEEAMQMMGE